MKSTYPCRTKLQPKIRRFNTSVLERDTTADMVQDKFSLLGYNLPYKEGRVRADSLHWQASILAFINSLITLFVIVCSFAENEFGYNGNLAGLQIDALRTIILTASLVQIMLTLKGAQKQLDLLKVLGDTHPNSKPQTASLLYDLRWAVPLFCEIVHLCIVMPPLIDFSTYEDYPNNVRFRVSMGDFITCAIVFRLYHVISFIRKKQRRRLHGIYNSPKFIVYAQLNARPFRTLVVVGMSIMVISGILFHIAERSSKPNLMIYDGPWFIAVTQMTVGYGDITPVTDMGKIIAMGPGLFSVLTWSLVVTYALRNFEMDRSEKRMAERLYRTQYVRTHYGSLAVTLLQRWWRLKLSRRHKDPFRLKKLLELKSIHELFNKKFAADLAGLNPELEDEIGKFHQRVRRDFRSTLQKLKEATILEKQAGIFSTKASDLFQKALLCKQVFHRVIFWGRRKGRHKSAVIQARRRKSNKRSSIGEKKLSDIAIRKLKCRMSLAQQIQFPSGLSTPSPPDSPVLGIVQRSKRRISCGS